MKLRFKSWLLVALLIFTANFGVTVSRVAPPRQPNTIVQVLRAVDEAQAEAPIATAARPDRPLLRVRPELRRAADPLDATLFQRPPPSFFLSA